MMTLSDTLKQEILTYLQTADFGESTSHTESIGGRMVYFFVGADAAAQADQAHQDILTSGKIPLCGVQNEEGVHFFVT